MPKVFDLNGVQLADVPGSGVVRKDPNAKSGNPNHDTRSGKFGGGGGNRNPAPPANTDAVAYGRMLDAVREAARSIDEPNEDTIAEFIQARATSPDQVDVAGFLAMVRQQRVADLIDVLDGQLKGTKYKVRLQANKVYLRKILRSVDENEAQEVIQRLQAMGHDAKKVAKLFPNAPQETAAEKKLEASDDDPIGDAPEGWLALEDSEYEVEDSQPVIHVHLPREPE
jgi:hypothetical protein